MATSVVKRASRMFRECPVCSRIWTESEWAEREALPTLSGGTGSRKRDAIAAIQAAQSIMRGTAHRVDLTGDQLGTVDKVCYWINPALIVSIATNRIVSACTMLEELVNHLLICCPDAAE